MVLRMGIQMKTEKKNKIKVWYLILFSLIQFPLKIAGMRWLAYMYIYFLPALYLMKNINWTVCFFKRMKYKYSEVSIWIFAYLICVSCIWPIVTGSFDLTYITVYWRSVILILLKYTFLLAVYERHINRHAPSSMEFCDYYIYSVILYITFSAIIFLVPALRSILMNVLYLEPEDIMNLEKPAYFSRFGWGGWSGYGATMQCTLSLTFACVNIICGGCIRKQIKYLMLSAVLMAGNSFYGRTGLVVSLICILLTTLYAVYEKRLGYLFCVLFLALVLVSALYLMKLYIPAMDNWFQWVFSAITNFRKTGRFYDNMGSVETIVTRMYWWPDSDTLLFGDGCYTDGNSYYMHTDSGIMRPVLYYGIINYLMSLAAYFLIVNQLCRKVTSDRKGCKKKYIRIIFLMYFIMTMLFEIKGESFCTLFGMIFPVAFIKEQRLSQMTSPAKSEKGTNL